MSIKNVLGLCFLIGFGWSCEHAVTLPSTVDGDRYFAGDSVRRNAIYFGGTIITMEGDKPDTTQEAVVVHDGIITFIGKRDDAFKSFPAHQYLHVDLKGSTLLPGFVDGHGHFSQVAMQVGSANLLPPDQPGGTDGVTSIKALQTTMKDFIKKTIDKKGPQTQYLGMNYDNTQFVGADVDKRHPTKDDLDGLCDDKSVFIVVIHQSGHVGSVNSAVLKHPMMKGIIDTGIAGGTVGRYPGTTEPTGYLEENALMEVMKVLKAFPQSETFELFDETSKKYAENGFTTVQDGRTIPSNWNYLKQYDFARKLKLDVVAYPDLIQTWAADSHALAAISKHYTAGSRFRTGGVKFSLDGSPQGRTAWFLEPYLKNPSTTPLYNGFPIFDTASQSTLKRLLKQSLEKKWQILAHCNGDATSKQLIDIFSALDIQKSLPKDHRTTIIHAQFITQQQVTDAKRLGMSISTYPLHTFYWGDVHAENLGIDRANRMSPTRWMVNEKVNFSIHTDAPVIFPRSIPLFMTAVRRVTREGKVYGADQCLTPYEALQAMTIAPAYHHFEENSKGSIKVGKIADFVILDKNPLQYPFKPAPKNNKGGYEGYNFNEIQIWETIKNGIPVYQNKNSGVKQFVKPGQVKPEPQKLTLGCG
jgi:predicted amidohydrolase YtcJ